MQDSEDRQIAIFLPSLSGGGAEKNMTTLANAFSSFGFKVDIILASREGVYLEKVAREINIVDLNCKRISRAIPGLVSYLRSNRPIVLLSTLSHANIVSILATKLSGTRTKVFVREAAVISPKEHWTVKYRLILFFMRFTYRFANGVISVSAHVAHEMVNKMRVATNKSCQANNPTLDASFFANLQLPSELDCVNNAASPVIVSVGRLTAQKDYPTLIRAFELVRQKREARLLILGEGEERESLEKLLRHSAVGKDVAIPGYDKNPIAALIKCDVFVLSSTWEGSPSVLIEAMAVGCKIVSTDAPGGASEILEKGKWGVLVPIGDPERMAEAMLAQLDSEAPEGMIEVAQERYSEDQCAKSYLRAMTLIR